MGAPFLCPLKSVLKSGLKRFRIPNAPRIEGAGGVRHQPRPIQISSNLFPKTRFQL